MIQRQPHTATTLYWRCERVQLSPFFDVTDIWIQKKIESSAQKNEEGKTEW
jgi:hypothetical protein